MDKKRVIAASSRSSATSPSVVMLDHIVAVKALDLPAGSYLVVGGSCLDVRGIRKSNDIDIVVTPETFALLQSRGWEIDTPFRQKWGRDRLKHDCFEVYSDMIIESENRFVPAADLVRRAEMFDGVPFLSFDEFIFFKRENSREKDLADIALIEEYLRTNTWSDSTS